MKATGGHDVEFEISALSLRGKRWGNSGGVPVIALHGWLDNCASFDFLTPLLENVDLIALDLAGHGRSAHRSAHAAYNIWLDVSEVLEVAEHVGWKEFALLGHSRGAMIATLLAGAFPEKITHLAVIEALIPQPQEADEAPAQLASSINVLKSLRQKPRRYYQNFESAEAARRNGFVALNHEDAHALAVRGVQQDDRGYYWANDYKAMAPSEIKFTLEQAEAFLKCLNLDVALFAGEGGLVNSFHELDNLLIKYPHIKKIELTGSHHLHMSEQCEAIARYLNDYFQKQARHR